MFKIVLCFKAPSKDGGKRFNALDILVCGDEDEIERASRAIDRRIYQWGRDNSDTIEPIAMSVKAIVEEYLTRKTSTDNIRAESMITILNAAKTAFYPNPETCDEEAFTTCLINDESVDILRYGAPDIEDMFDLADMMKEFVSTFLVSK